MQQTTIGISYFGVIFVGLIVISIGLGALKLLSLLLNTMTGRGKSQPHARAGAWSGITTALVVTATMFLGLLALALLGIFWVRSSTQVVTSNSTHHATSLEHAEMERAQQLADSVEIEQAEKVEQILAEAADEKEVEAASDARQTGTVAKTDRTAEQAAFIEARKAELQQLVSKIGQYVSSNLEKVGDKEGATFFGKAAKSDNGDVVVFQPSDEMVQQILGAGGRDLLKSFNSELPGRIRQTYALIPLTPPVGSTVSVRPLLAAGGLESIANSIVSFVESAESPAVLSAADARLSAQPAEADGQLTSQPEIRSTPAWMSETDGRRIVVETKPILEGDDTEVPLTVAINEALAKHVRKITATMNPILHEQAKFVRMELPQATAKKFILDDFARRETIETETEGPKKFQIRYALLEFPEAVDQIAVRQIRQSIQQDRIMGLGVVVGLVWLSVCSAGFGIRQWRKGTRLRRIAAAPLFAVITLPTLLLAIGMVLALTRGDVPHRPWNTKPVTIDLQNV